MKPARLIVLRDLAIGSFGLLQVGSLGQLTPVLGLLLCLSGLVAAGVWFLSDRDGFPDWVDQLRDRLRERPAMVVLGTGLLVVLLLAPLLMNWSLLTYYHAVFVGLYLGTLANRLVFGLVRPVPQAAVNRVRDTVNGS